MSFFKRSLKKYTVNNENELDEEKKEKLYQIIFSHHPTKIQCFYCKKTIITSIRPKTGLLSYLSSLAFISFCCIIGCCFLPFIFKDCKDTAHTCPNCDKELFIYKRI